MRNVHLPSGNFGTCRRESLPAAAFVSSALLGMLAHQRPCPLEPHFSRISFSAADPSRSGKPRGPGQQWRRADKAAVQLGRARMDHALDSYSRSLLPVNPGMGIIGLRACASVHHDRGDDGGIGGKTSGFAGKDDAARRAFGKELCALMLSGECPGSFLHSELRAPRMPIEARESLSIMCSSPEKLFGKQRAAPVLPGGCRLCGSDLVRDVTDPALSAWLLRMFQAVADQTRSSISQYDLHHGHCFSSNSTPSYIGLLFHLCEYPQRTEKFPHHLGHCQKGSNVTIGEEGEGRRNVVWVWDGRGDGEMGLLDTRCGSVLSDRLVVEGLEEVGTVWEGDLGDGILADFTLLPRDGAVSSNSHVVATLY